MVNRTSCVRHSAYNKRRTPNIPPQLRPEFVRRFPPHKFPATAIYQHDRIRQAISSPDSTITLPSLIDIDDAMKMLPTFMRNTYDKYCRGEITSLAHTRIFLDGIHYSSLVVKKRWTLILETLKSSSLTSSFPGTAISELPPLV